MKTIKIDGRDVSFTEGETILEVARRNNVFIPTLCEMHDLNHHPGVCRVCMVRVEKKDALVPVSYVASCDTPAQEGIEVFTRTADVLAMRRRQLDLVLSDHNQECTTCARLGDCELMDASLAVRLEKRDYISSQLTAQKQNESSPIVYDASRCIKCQRCVTACRDIQDISALVFAKQGDTPCIQLRNGFPRDKSDCISCGQCVMVCPTGAMAERDDTSSVIEYLADPDIVTVFQIAPAVRIAFSAEYHLPPDANLEGQIVTALRRMGADVVLDTNFGADIVIMEEGHEVLERMTQKKGVTFTSCCPGWVSYVEKHYPEFKGALSTTRSPQQCLGSLIKNYLAQKNGYQPEKVRVISIMPCTAKKDEAAREEFKTNGQPDVDVVLTIREFNKLIRRHGIHLEQLQPSSFDRVLSEYSGAGAIFGTTGGVMEAALRTLYYVLNGKEIDGVEISAVRGMEGRREATIDLGSGHGQAKVAICTGLKAARELLEDIKAKRVTYDFVEVMACPGGCISGGGHIQTKRHYRQHVPSRADSLYALDRKTVRRQSHNNKEVLAVYKNFLGKPLSHKAHTLLHTDYQNKQQGKVITLKRVVNLRK